jgi:hypothetical protein
LSVLRASILKVLIPLTSSFFPSSTHAARTAFSFFSQTVVFAQPDIPVRRERIFSTMSDFSSGASMK